MNLERSSLSFFQACKLRGPAGAGGVGPRALVPLRERGVDGFIGEPLLLHPCQRLLGGKGNEELAASRGNFVSPFVPWDTLEKAVLAFPNHKVLAGFLVEDSCSFFPATCGKAYYDLVTIENRTLEIGQDTVKK